MVIFLARASYTDGGNIVEKVFEDYFSELQEDMVSICLEYVEKRADKIYIYCSFEGNMLSSGFFYKVYGEIVKKNKLNDALIAGQKEYDVSVARQKGVINIINDDIKALRKLCEEYQKEMPTQIKLIYEVTTNKLNADYSYELIFSNHKSKTAYDVMEEWYKSEKEREEITP
jgi:hypothetical protein